MQPVLGIIAGGGSLPRQLIDHCVASNIPFYIVAVKGQAEPGDIENYPHTWVRFGQGRKLYETLKAHDVIDVVMIGRMRRPAILTLQPDWFVLKLLPQLGLAWLGDDGLLRNIIRIIEKLGFRVRGVHEFLPELLAPAGVMTTAKPTPQGAIDIQKGVAAAMDLGFADIGQSVVVRNGIVIQREARSGTDAMLGKVTKSSNPNGVMVKLCKPQQDRRVDLPTIGPRTIENAVKAGLEGIAISAECTLIDDVEKTVQLADKHGLFIIGLTP
jgi:UDP-2,3-diacylglucosamine hydrolase